MKVLTSRKIKHVKAQVNSARDYARRVKELEKDAEVEAKREVEPTEKELAALSNMLDELKYWNDLTFEFAKQIDELEKSNNNLLKLNQVSRRNERANRKAWDTKKQLKRDLNKYVRFIVSIPKQYGEVEYKTYAYESINEAIEYLIKQVDESYSEGEQLVKDILK